MVACAVSGCTVARAAAGRRSDKLSLLYEGQDRAILLQHWGHPKKTVVVEGARRDTFLLSAGDAPSGGRALGHATMDVLTMGMWEIIGGGYEDSHSRGLWLTVEYDEHEKVSDAYVGETRPE